MRYGYASIAAILFFAATALGAGEPYLGQALADVQSSDPAAVQQSISKLRAAGPGGLAALLEVYDRHPDAKLLPAIDAVAGQRDAVVSRLYWYTDLSQAEAAAKAQHKPILYLRLLGKLTDQFSCANSRFFRTVLYSNKDVSAMLREQFVLVWVSERPVPVVTIDYGDGRVLKCTITGNSIHYVLSPDGQVYDALPGLFDPQAFRAIVGGAWMVARNDVNRTLYLHAASQSIHQSWQKDTARLASSGDAQGKLAEDATAGQAAPNNANQAAAAMRRTFTKSGVEAPLLADISPQAARQMDQSIDAADAAMWKMLADIHMQNATLDAQSIALIKSQNPAAYVDPAALSRTVAQFQETIAEDSVRDNYQMRRQVLDWLQSAAGSKPPMTVEDLNRRVYTELFLTPRSDPWLGLAPLGTYTALPDDGCCAAPAPTR
jgi:hypothetical protein